MGNDGEAKSFVEEEPGGCNYDIKNYNNTAFDVENWQISDKKSFQSIESLSEYLPLKQEEKTLLKKIVNIYHIRIPHYYLSLIKDFSDNRDPIRRQCIPSSEELAENSFEKEDPLGEKNDSFCSCLVHRYPDRALLLVTNRCFMYCRHCTRKRIWPSVVKEPTLEEIKTALEYVRTNKKIREIIISGGDPLTLPTERLECILSSIATCENIQVIRIGTRAPVVFPQRIDKSLCKMLEKYQNIWVNVQFNHPREVTPESTIACRKLQRLGIPVSNQSVLLKGINDDYKVMTELCQKLQRIRIRPYYLFQCDPVVGTTHFQTPVDRGIEIIKKMRGFTSGMCVPAFVVDGIDGKGKVPLQPNYLVSREEGYLILKNYKEDLFEYHNPEERKE